MDEAQQTKINRLMTVGLGCLIWVSLMRMLLGESLSMVWPILMGMWIAFGSAHLVENVRDFRSRMRPRAIVLAALISPAWPWLRADR